MASGPVESARVPRSLASRLFSDDWQMPIALATGCALLIGYSLQVIVGDALADAAAAHGAPAGWARWAGIFQTAGHALVWISLFLGAIHGLKAAWESIRAFEPNIDVLMVVGAGLAAGIGHPGEGALLLFMFTLAGALEHRALAKAKDAVARLSKLMPDEALRRVGNAAVQPAHALDPEKETRADPLSAGTNHPRPSARLETSAGALAPASAAVAWNGVGAAAGSWEPVKPEHLVRGDEILVRPGETVPADGIVIQGRSTIDQSTLTGESLPRAVEPGDDVFAGTMNQNGALEVRVTRPVTESSLKRILDLVIEAQEKRQPMQRLIDRFSTPYTIGVFGAAAAVFLWFAVAGRMTDVHGSAQPMSLAEAAMRAITLLIVASPCALVIATPTATLCGLNRAARAGLLVKGGDALERLARVRTVAIDKTGTLTTGRIEVVSTVLLPALGDAQAADAELNRLLAVALAIEERSTHPVAAAITRYARARGVQPAAIDGFEMLAGRGIRATAGGEPAAIGTLEYVAPHMPAGLRAEAERAVASFRASGGVTAVFTHRGRAIVFDLEDALRPGAGELGARLRAVGVQRIVMLTGDHAIIAAKVAREVGIDEYHADLLPEQKVECLRRIREEQGAKSMPAASSRNGARAGLAVVGDGVNDAPALAIADVGLAMGGIGADAALETADVVVLNDDLSAIPWVIGLAQRVQRVMLVNLLFALAVIVTLAVLALAGMIPMGVGVIGHEGSTLIVVANSLQLLAHRR